MGINNNIKLFLESFLWRLNAFEEKIDKMGNKTNKYLISKISLPYAYIAGINKKNPNKRRYKNSYFLCLINWKIPIGTKIK